MKIISLNTIKFNMESQAASYNNSRFSLSYLKADTTSFTGKEKSGKVKSLIDLYNQKQQYLVRLKLLRDTANENPSVALEFLDELKKIEKNQVSKNAIEHYTYVAEERNKSEKPNIELTILAELEDKFILNRGEEEEDTYESINGLLFDEQAYLSIAKNQRLLPEIRYHAATILAKKLKDDPKHFVSVLHDLNTQKQENGKVLNYNAIFMEEDSDLTILSNSMDFLGRKFFTEEQIYVMNRLPAYKRKNMKDESITILSHLIEKKPRLLTVLSEEQLDNLESYLKKPEMQYKEAQSLSLMMGAESFRIAHQAIDSYLSGQRASGPGEEIQAELMCGNEHYIHEVKSIVENTEESTDKRIDAIDLLAKGCCYKALMEIASNNSDNMATILSIAKLKQSDNEEVKEFLAKRQHAT